MRILGILALGAALGGCASAPKVLWLRADGQRAADNPVLKTQYELDSTACLGERSRANLSGVTLAQGGFAGIAAAAERGRAADSVQQGCMAEKGYLLVQEDQAEAKQAELAAVAELKKRQEAASPPLAAKKLPKRGAAS